MTTPSEPAYEVRAYQPEDWSAIARAHDEARLQELAPSVGVQAFLDLATTADHEGLFDDRVWVAADARGQVVGFVAYAEAEVTWLYVHPDAQGRGAGRALLRHALAYADALGVPAVEVTMLDGGPARPLYESEGFRLVETKTGALVGNKAFAATGHILRRTRPSS